MNTLFGGPFCHVEVPVMHLPSVVALLLMLLQSCHVPVMHLLSVVALLLTLSQSLYCVTI